MRFTLALVALAVLVGAGVLGAALYLQGSQPIPPAAPIDALAPAPPQPSAFSWRLTAAMSAHRALVLEVETARPAEAVAIAQRLTDLYADRYDEILVYFFEPEVRPHLATVRVQWTRTGGYRTLALRASDQSFSPRGLAGR